MKEKIQGFHFQEISLEEAQHAILVGSGNYASIKSALLSALSELDKKNEGKLLEERKSLVFGMPKKGMEKKDRVAICFVINRTLRASGLLWRVSYSSLKNLFICIPIDAEPMKRKYRKAVHDDENDLTPKKYSSDESPSLPEQLVSTTAEIFDYQGDYKDQIGKRIRKAICVVGLNDLGLKPRELSGLVGIQPSSVYFNAKLASKSYGKEEIGLLRKAFIGRKKS